jgi:hypothetical protein
MDELISKIKSKRPNIKDSSLNMYIINLRKLNKEIGDSSNEYSLDVIKQKSKVDKFLETKAKSTKKNYYATIVVLLMTEENEDKDLIDKYRVEMEELDSSLKEMQKSQEKTEKQKQNWASLEELQKVMKTYNREIDVKGLFKKENLTKSELDLIQKYVITCLYVLDPENNPPLRSDYSMTMINIKDYNKMKDSELKQNYLVIRGQNKKFFHLGEFKTQGKFDNKVIPVGKKLNTVLNKWLKVNPTKFLLFNRSLEMMTANQLTKAVKSAFSPLNKNGLGISMIRHIVISTLFPPQNKEKEELADKMLHSIEVQTNVYSKN